MSDPLNQDPTTGFHMLLGKAPAGWYNPDMTDLMERDLVERAREGDDAAFAALMTRYKGPVLNFIWRLTGDRDGAEDDAQTTFVRAYRNLRRFSFRRPQDRFSTWLFAIAHHTALDSLRRRRRHPEQPLELTSESSIPASGADPASEAANRETGRLIQAAILALPEDQRTALILSVYHDMSQAEVARVMKTTEKSVESRLYRGRQFLRVRLERPMSVRQQ